MPTLAIIGTGIAGLGCAHFLHRGWDLTVFETGGHVGGHSHTVEVIEPHTGRALPVDTGFMVFNRVTYPHLCRLFDTLGVPVKPTDMSFSVRDRVNDIEWCGSSLNHLFAQRGNLLRPRFWRMLAQVNRFNREAVQALSDPAWSGVTLESYVARRGYGRDFLELYLVPMSSAVWSTPPARLLAFPATTLLRFFHNHGFLGLNTQHPWWTVEGGAREYVRRLIAPWQNRIHVGVGAARVERTGRGVVVTATTGERTCFDQVILATHADQALALLADATAEEQRILGAFHYQENIATVHTDVSVMPRRRLAWASWNYERINAATADEPATHYWMNRLQGVSERENYFVSINRPDRIHPERILRTLRYQHPLFDLGAVRAQADLPALNLAGHHTGTYFAGSYFRYGFHEDALLSAVTLSQQLLGRDPWATPSALTAETAPLAV